MYNRKWVPPPPQDNTIIEFHFRFQKTDKYRFLSRIFRGFIENLSRIYRGFIEGLSRIYLPSYREIQSLSDRSDAPSPLNKAKHNTPLPKIKQYAPSPIGLLFCLKKTGKISWNYQGFYKDLSRIIPPSKFTPKSH